MRVLRVQVFVAMFVAASLAGPSAPSAEARPASGPAGTIAGARAQGTSSSGTIPTRRSIPAAGRAWSFGRPLVPRAIPLTPAGRSRLAVTQAVSLELDGTIDLNSLGELIHDRMGWGVVISGPGTTKVAAGTWSDTLANIVAAIGTANGFTPSWNDDTGVLSLTVD